MVVQPGAFRTNFSGSSQMHGVNDIEAYRPLMEMRRQNNDKMHGHQPGDPVRGARIIVEALDRPSPPWQLPLGEDAANRIVRKLAKQSELIGAEVQLAATADFPAGK